MSHQEIRSATDSQNGFDDILVGQSPVYQNASEFRHGLNKRDQHAIELRFVETRRAAGHVEQVCNLGEEELHGDGELRQQRLGRVIKRRDIVEIQWSRTQGNFADPQHFAGDRKSS